MPSSHKKPAKFLDALFLIAPPNAEETKTCRRVYLQCHLYEFHFDFVIKLPATPLNVCCKIWKNGLAGEKSPSGCDAGVHKVIECLGTFSALLLSYFLRLRTFLNGKIFGKLFKKFHYTLIIIAFFQNAHLITSAICSAVFNFFLFFDIQLCKKQLLLLLIKCRESN